MQLYPCVIQLTKREGKELSLEQSSIITDSPIVSSNLVVTTVDPRADCAAPKEDAVFWILIEALY
jgi:hypothetical protein